MECAQEANVSTPRDVKPLQANPCLVIAKLGNGDLVRRLKESVPAAETPRSSCKYSRHAPHYLG